MSAAYRIFSKINRPDKAVVAQFEGIPVADISDEMSRFASMDAGLRPLNKIPLLGPALTVRARSGDNLVINHAIDIAEPGDVVVIDADGDSTHALIGEYTIMWAMRRGIAGLIIDGAVRDLDAISELKFPCYARHIQPNGPYKNGRGEINVPVCCGRQVVNPGDIIVGDADGIVVIPPSEAEQVLRNARTKLEKSAATRQAILAGTWDRSRYTRDALKAAGCELIDDVYPAART